MWKLTLSVAIVFSALSANASFVTITQCDSASSTHTLKIIQDGDDAEVTLGDKKPHKYDDLVSKAPGNKKYKLTGQMTNTFRVADISLPELRDTQKVTELVASLMFQRPEFDGEYDMVYSYASDLVHDLNCR
ncbi:hypothetical protein ACES2J_06935 [Bdellovibrio bacteriovorus]|uniref:hypothetical protein n=1 Tax=Bdellovibrio bacteriovorus TaxID=959 RepID=UPI0035A61A34